ncbi:MAG: polysaccharide biosynthesis protein [Bacteroidota bacterium]
MPSAQQSIKFRTTITKLKFLVRDQKIEKWLALGKLTTFTGFAQVAIQAIGFISGILVIRILPTEEYALYTLANTMLGTMIILADGGISSGVMSEGGKVWKNRHRLGEVIETGIYLRKRFAIFSLVIATPILFYLLHHHGASWLSASLILLALIPAFFTALSGSILEIVPKLHQDITGLQKIQVLSNLGRLGLLGLTIFVFPWAYVAILAAGLPQIWANFQIRKRSRIFSEETTRINQESKKQILALVKRLMPGAVYYAFSGQITIWLISIFGSTMGVAQIGGLGRLTMTLSVFFSLFGTLVVPRFARLSSKESTIGFFLLSQLGLIILAIILVLLVKLFSTQLLWLLGNEYSDLSRELLLIFIAAGINLISGCTHVLLSSRGIVLPPVLYIIGIITFQIILLLMLDISSVLGVITFNIFSTLFLYVLRLGHFFLEKKI